MTDRLDALMVRSYQSGNETKNAYTRIGVAFPLANGEGYRLKLEAVPVPTIYEGKIDCTLLLVPPKEFEDNRSPSKPSKAPAFEGAGGGGGDDIPFSAEWR